jgi:hypothetical protein
VPLLSGGGKEKGFSFDTLSGRGRSRKFKKSIAEISSIPLSFEQVGNRK